MAFIIKYDLEAITKSHIPLTMKIDSCSLFHFLTRAFFTTEERLMIDLQTIKNTYQPFEVNDIAFIRSNCSNDDGLTKLKDFFAIVKAL